VAPELQQARYNSSRFQVSGFSAAVGLKSGQFDQKTDSSVVESDMSILYLLCLTPET
jgi:hypothetical protein